ncbi:hypothetical protein BV25DRAFT_1818041 [Artomyces pyxidatus]|uniref:Uncharacterized protein n=1 Tax=Artomyces pyxidatus TaxID=48021 RepID=A0ACB8TL30_9AGAM|nr:hypothetical protein BV25DRAFT_1818041 [Artomyces pyxidatus]
MKSQLPHDESQVSSSRPFVFASSRYWQPASSQAPAGVSDRVTLSDEQRRLHAGDAVDMRSMLNHLTFNPLGVSQSSLSLRGDPTPSETVEALLRCLPNRYSSDVDAASSHSSPDSDSTLVEPSYRPPLRRSNELSLTQLFMSSGRIGGAHTASEVLHVDRQRGRGPVVDPSRREVVIVVAPVTEKQIVPIVEKPRRKKRSAKPRR